MHRARPDPVPRPPAGRPTRVAELATLRAKLLAIELSTRVARRESTLELTRPWLEHIEELCLEAAYHLGQVVGFGDVEQPAAMRTAVDVVRLLTEVVERHRGIARRFGTTLDLRTDPSAPPASADEVVLGGVLASIVMSVLQQGHGRLVRAAVRPGPREGWVSVRVVVGSQHARADAADGFDLPFCRAAIERFGGTLRSWAGPTGVGVLLALQGMLP